jgi:hypothetical protein
MPSWYGILTAAEIDAIWAYIRATAGAAEGAVHSRSVHVRGANFGHASEARLKLVAKAANRPAKAWNCRGRDTKLPETDV